MTQSATASATPVPVQWLTNREAMMAEGEVCVHPTAWVPFHQTDRGLVSTLSALRRMLRP